MDLVLLKPGDDKLADIVGDHGKGGSQVEGPIVGIEDTELKQCIELVSMHFGMKQQLTTDVSNTARTSGRPELHDITCIKYFDKTSTKLYKHCLAAIPLGASDIGDTDPANKTKIFVCRNSNWEGGSVIANIMTIHLGNALISAIESQSHPNDMATEQLTLNFTDISWTYTVQDHAAISKGQIAFGWNVASNRNL